MLLNKKLNVAQGFYTSFPNIGQTLTQYRERKHYQVFGDGNFENTVSYCEKRTNLNFFK